MGQFFGTEHVDDVLVCSAKGCVNPATHKLLWNNPKIHTAHRRKVWLACDDHERSLTDFLDRRGFWKSTEPMAR